MQFCMRLQLAKMDSKMVSSLSHKLEPTCEHKHITENSFTIACGFGDDGNLYNVVTLNKMNFALCYDSICANTQMSMLLNNTKNYRPFFYPS